MPFPSLNRLCYLNLAAMISVLTAAGMPSLGLIRAQDRTAEAPLARPQQTAVVVDEEPAVVIADDAPAVVVGEEDPATEVWNPQPAVVQRNGGRVRYLRPTGEAFVDPDQRLSLEIKYFFPLDEQPDMPRKSLSHAGDLPDGARVLLAPQASVKLHADVFPIAVDAGTSSGRFELEWLDYHVSQPQHAVLLVTGRTAAPMAEAQPPGATNVARDVVGNGTSRHSGQPVEASLQVLRLRGHVEDWEVTRQRAARSFAKTELPERWVTGGLLDTWDRWPELGDRAAFVGRVIAVLKRIDSRYAVDFYGESLHVDSDCRVWLSPVGHAWGRPVAIRFVDLPVKKGPDAIGRVSALAIRYEDGQSSSRWIAIDYPLCRSPMLEQLRQIARRLESRSSGRNRRSPPQLSDIVGEDLADELERRLVDGVYR